MKKNQVQRHLSLRCKIKAEHVELCIIDNATGSIQYECIPINFDVVKKEVKPLDNTTETVDQVVDVEEGGNE